MNTQIEKRILSEVFPKWTIEEKTGYRPKTTFWQTFTLADVFGADLIKETYRGAFDSSRNNYIDLTELCLVLDWKRKEHTENENGALARLYDNLYQLCAAWATSNLTGRALEYFRSVTS